MYSISAQSPSDYDHGLSVSVKETRTGKTFGKQYGPTSAKMKNSESELSHRDSPAGVCARRWEPVRRLQ